MANTASNVSAGKPKVGGAIFVADIGTTLPTDATTALAATFTCLGYVTEDGLTNSNSPESETVKAWGGDTVLTLATGREDTFSFKLMEIKNIEVLKMVYGDTNVTGSLSDTNGIQITANAKSLEHHVIVVDMVLSGTDVKRIVIPDGSLTELGDITYSDSDAIGYEMTISALPDASGNTHYEYIKTVS